MTSTMGSADSGETTSHSSVKAFGNANMPPSFAIIFSRDEDSEEGIRYNIILDGNTVTTPNAILLEDMGDFGPRKPPENNIEKGKLETKGQRRKLEKGTKIFVVFAYGLETYPIIIGAIPNSSDAKVKGEYDLGDVFIHESGTKVFIDNTGDVFVQHKDGNELIMDSDGAKLTDSNENVFTMKSTGVTIGKKTGPPNFEVLQ